MHNEVKISDGLYYVGGSSRRLALFENVYPLTNGASFNSYLYLDEKTLLLDTVDRAVSDVFYGNLEFLLGERKLDYLIVNHMEPDHAANIGELLLRHPETTIVINPMAKKFLLNFFPDIKAEFLLVKEGDKLSIGKHEFTFVMAPMVHWPEVMMTYELTEATLFSADAFGTFGALQGDIYASPKNFDLSEARRYYTNIVGKYGPQVQAVLKKAAGLRIEKILPLHGPALLTPEEIGHAVKQYGTWSSYGVESEGVCIAYTSVYGHTKAAALKLAEMLKARGCPKVAVADLARDDMPETVEDAFRYGKLVLATTTYNADIFPFMRTFIEHLVERNYQNRTVGLIENGSWAPMAAKVMRGLFEKSKGISFCENTVTITSALGAASEARLAALADELAR